MKTIGEFYREKVLSLPKKSLSKIELPDNYGEIKIEKDLFGWKLYSGKNYIECRSKEEARYLRVFLDSGMKRICVPKDDEYLRTILPELERLKMKIDEILNSYLETILNRRIRQRVRHEVFIELTK
jgi:hypothetical protein